MQVVININDGTYEAIKNEYCALPPQKGLKKVLWDAVKDGTPLPKGHGRLGDLDELTQRITNYVEHNEHMMDELTLLQEKFILEGIKNTPTIIEADREV